MIDDKDVKKLVKALEGIFPTAEMVQEGFNDVTSKMATKVEMEKGFEKVDKRLNRIEGQSEEIKSLKDRVKVLEDALAIE